MVDFGVDVSCVSDLNPEGRTVTGNAIVAEALARRWSTRRGDLINDPNYGYDLEQWLNEDVSPRDIAEMQVNMAAEALKDERVEECTVEVTLVNGIFNILATVTTAAGPFTLTGKVNTSGLITEIQTQ